VTELSRGLFVRIQYVRTPFLTGILITSGLAFFGFFLNGHFLFSGQRRHGGIGDEEVVRRPRRV
jgi:hypothetical protein